MLDKLIEMVKAQRSLKRVCVFFLAFAASLAVMGSSHDIFYGSGSEKARTAQEGAAKAGKSGINCDSASDTKVNDSLAYKEFSDSFMPVIQASKLEEIVTTAVADKQDSPKVKSNMEENANGEEADTVKKKSKASDTAVKKDTEAEDETAKKKKTEESGESADETDESSGFVYSEHIPMSHELQKYTYEKCEERGLEYELVLAIIWRESRFTVDAVHVNTNGTRDNGIMQINDINRKWLKDHYGITDLMDPYQNIDAGTAMLGRLTNKYGAHNAMLAYQYGEGGMARKLKQGITTSTAVEKAYQQRDYYRKII